MKTQESLEWWHEFYQEFRPVFGILPAKSASTLVRRIISELNLRKGSTFLDCPSGYGRVSIPLARKGLRVTAVDIMPAYLKELEQRARRAKVKIPTVHRDMRRISFENQFDAAANIWTSFGYFEKESDNLLVLKKYFKALKPGGRFFMTVINRDWVVANFSRADYMDTGKVRVIETRSFDYERSASISNWHFLREGEEVVRRSYIRMYSLHELLAMMKSVGFTDVRGYGSGPDEEISQKTRMMTIVGTKPKKQVSLKRSESESAGTQASSKTTDSDGWWTAFAADARSIFDTISSRETRDHVNYVMSSLQLKPGSRFLDCGCGIGRVGLPLAAKGVKVTGIDVSTTYLAEFREKARRRKLTIDIKECDMRHIPFEREFDAVGSLWTSFGFFQKDSDNTLGLKKMYRALKPGGRFILTLTNRDWIISEFTPTGWQDIRGGRLLQKRWVDYARSASISDWHFLKDGKETVHRVYVRLYSLHEMRAILESIGFVNVNIYGSMKDEPLTSESRWMVVVAERAK